MDGAIDIRHIYAGAAGNGSLSVKGLGDMDSIADSANKLQRAGNGGGSLLDAIGGILGGAGLIKGLVKRGASLTKKGTASVKRLLGKEGSVAKAAGTAAEGVDDAMRAAGSVDDVAKVAGTVTKAGDGIETVAKSASLASKAGSAISTGAKFLGKAAIPLTVITSSAEVLVTGQKVEEGSVTDTITRTMGEAADNLEHQGFLGRAASALMTPLRNSVTIGSSIVEETVGSARKALGTVFSSDASLLDKAGSVLDLAGGAQIRGALTGTNRVIGDAIDHVFDAQVERDNEAHRLKCEAMIADKIAHMSPEGRARYEASKRAATDRGMRARSEHSAAARPPAIEMATTIPAPPVRPQARDQAGMALQPRGLEASGA